MQEVSFGVSRSIYYKLPTHTGSLTDTQGVFCFDQQKWNLFGLAEPRIDSEGVEAARLNPIAESICERMSTPLREALKLPPDKFMGEAEGFIESMAYLDKWPSGYMDVIRRRAQEVCRRQLGVSVVSNVIHVNFRRAA